MSPYEKYERKFDKNHKIKQEKPIPQNSIYEDKNDVFTNIILMLNQCLTELAAINEKLILKETSQPIVKTAEENLVKKRFMLLRDDTGKIIGADVVEHSNGSALNEQITEEVKEIEDGGSPK